MDTKSIIHDKGNLSNKLLGRHLVRSDFPPQKELSTYKRIINYFSSNKPKSLKELAFDEVLTQVNSGNLTLLEFINVKNNPKEYDAHPKLKFLVQLFMNEKYSISPKPIPRGPAKILAAIWIYESSKQNKLEHIFDNSKKLKFDNISKNISDTTTLIGWLKQESNSSNETNNSNISTLIYLISKTSTTIHGFCPTSVKTG